MGVGVRGLGYVVSGDGPRGVLESEGDESWLARGNRKVRYRGIARNDHRLHHRSAALNLRLVCCPD